MARPVRRRRRPNPSALPALVLAILSVAAFARSGLAAHVSAQELAVPAPSVAMSSWPRSAVDLTVDGFRVHLPVEVATPAVALLVLHGMGGTGEQISQSLRDYTDPLGWVVVAPTFNYGDWQDPNQLTREALGDVPRMASFLDRLPEITGLPFQSRALVYGFSRGGQEANRFALAYPERVAAVAMMSCGTYTLPARWTGSDAQRVALRFPYGTSDFADLFGRDFDADTFDHIAFWVGVGGRDNDPADVPRQWDPYLGNDRTQRAQRFTASLQSTGVHAQLNVFPDVGHAETANTRSAAIAFLSTAQTRLASTTAAASLPTTP
jgi:pimeloyl-ACP methyl ester carboxylesterase